MMGPFSLKRRGNRLQIILVCAFHSIPQRNRPLWFSWLLCWFYLIVCIRLEFSQCEMSSIIYMLFSSLIWHGAPDFIGSGFAKLIYCLGFLCSTRKNEYGMMFILHLSAFRGHVFPWCWLLNSPRFLLTTTYTIFLTCIHFCCLFPFHWSRDNFLSWS